MTAGYPGQNQHARVAQAMSVGRINELLQMAHDNPRMGLKGAALIEEVQLVEEVLRPLRSMLDHFCPLVFQGEATHEVWKALISRLRLVLETCEQLAPPKVVIVEQRQGDPAGGHQQPPPADEGSGGVRNT